MKGDVIPDADHVARYCPASCVDGNEIQPTAFRLRRPQETYLSVNWLESLKLQNRADEVAALQKILATKLTIGSRARIAVLNVGNTRAHVRGQSPNNHNLPVLHEPEDADPSHSGIHDIDLDNETMISELIAQTVLEAHPAK